MGLIWTPQQRIRQPQNVTKAPGLAAAWNMSVAADVVSGQPVSQSSYSSNVITSQGRGIWVSSTASLGRLVFNSPQFSIAPGAGDFSVLWFGRWVGNISAYSLFGRWNTGASVSTCDWYIGAPSSFNTATAGFIVACGSSIYTATSSALAWTAGDDYVVIGTRRGTTIGVTACNISKNLKASGSTTNAGITTINYNSARSTKAGEIDAGASYNTSLITYAAATDRKAWSSEKINALIQNPWQIFSPDQIPVWFTDAGGGITGTAEIIDGSDAAIASGLITHLGTSAVTESGDAATAIGYLSHLGAAALTDGADAASAAGRITHTATAAIVEGSDTAAATGTVGATSITGTAAITEAGDAAAAIGYLSHLGSAAITESSDIAAATGTAGDPLHGFTQDQLDFLVSYMEAHMAIPTAAENAAAVRTEIAVELAAVVRSEKWVRNKRTLDPSTGMQRIYDDDGATVLGEGAAWLDADGAQPYDGSGAVHRTERLA